MTRQARVLVACEYSGTIRDQFAALGWDAWSCDLLESDTPGNHIVGDVRPLLIAGEWDLLIAHPPCDFLTNCANRWLFEDSSRCTAAERLVFREEAIEFFRLFLDAPVPFIAIENPQPHPYVVEKVGRFADKVQPWMFGDPETKGVCWWLKGLPPLMSTVLESTREDKKFRMAPGPDRAKERARFFPKMARQCALQWGGAVLSSRTDEVSCYPVQPDTPC